MRLRPRFYDRQGNAINKAEWSRLHADPAYVVVAQMSVTGGIRVSTVWLGMDHQTARHGPPLIFESMITGGPRDKWVIRYPTELAAIAGHDLVVQIAGNDSIDFDAAARIINGNDDGR